MPRAFNKKQLSIAVSGVLSIVCCLTLPMVFASEKSSLPSQALHRKESLQFNIAAQKLDQALLQFAQQADVQLIFKSTEFGRWQGRSVQGEMLLEQGLTQLLADAPVTYEWITQQRVRLIPLDVNALVLQSQLVLADASTVVDTRNITQTAKDITRLAIQDERDLVSNITGVTVVEGGRGGSNGFSIRGVDADRVAVTVDGVAQAESFAPDVYKGYGYSSGNRNMPEIENMQAVDIHKGADSFSAGSGALGGAVSFRTKEPSDLIRGHKNVGGLQKVGYSSKNHEWRSVTGVAARNELVEGLVQYTKRSGHEIRSFNGGENITGWERSKADPMDTHSESWLVKLNACMTDSDCLKLGYEKRKQNNWLDERSFNQIFSGPRYINEYSPYERWSVGYTHNFTNDLFDRLEMRFAQQSIEQHTVSQNREKENPTLLFQQYDRNLTQDKSQFNVILDVNPLSFIGANHFVSAELESSQAKFKSENIDHLYHDNVLQGVFKNSLINPVNTDYFSFKVSDQITLTDKVSVATGLRYDRYQHQVKKSKHKNSYHQLPDNQKNTFSALTWYAGVNYQLSSEWLLGYKLSSGFRAPKAQEMYFEFQRGQNIMDPNPNLKAEKAINHELFANWKNQFFNIEASVFETRYQDFIDERHYQVEVPNPWYDPFYYPVPTLIEEHFQHLNVGKARLYGFELAANIDLHTSIGTPKGFSAYSKMTYSKGRLLGDLVKGDGMRALQPFDGLVGVRYDSNKNWGLSYDVHYYAAKKRRDTRRTDSAWQGVSVKYSKYLNRSATVSNLTGYWEVSDVWLVSGGVYNVFNKKYSTWDSMRSIPEFGTTNMIDWQDKGLHRFTAPARNFAVVLEARY